MTLGWEGLRKPVFETSSDDTVRAVESISPMHRDWFDRLRSPAHRYQSRTVDRWTREDIAAQEMRPDGVPGCMGTVGGGSSRQADTPAAEGKVSVQRVTTTSTARV
ncbi:hypothetical protein [Nocardia acidivorans]|uniref:hypothetical protein n=1 Tax=Nocardia acidivorans TaxID=404580 RepID=UPI0012FA18DD|nr:hypothetical protein [Nocardia acidivorans]